jgi:hypothetical protein
LQELDVCDLFEEVGHGLDHIDVARVCLAALGQQAFPLQPILPLFAYSCNPY